MMINKTQNKLRRFSAYCVTLAALSVPQVSAQTASWNSTKSFDLDSYIQFVMGVEDLPGLSVAVVLDGQIVYSGAFGTRTAGGYDPVTPATQFRLASSGKQLTTTMMASVVDSGAVTWNTPALSVLPGFQLGDANQTQTITYSDLVCNCTGALRRDLDLILNGLNNTTASAYSGLSSLQFPNQEGTFTYSNNLVAAGGWAGAVAGGGNPTDLENAFAQQVQTRVLGPTGMTSTTLSTDDVVARGNFAEPHSWNLFGDRQPFDLLANRFIEDYAPAGAFWSTSEDMAKYLMMQINDGVSSTGQQIASLANLEVLRTPQVNVAPGVDYGLGLFSTIFAGERLFFHGGVLQGTASDVAFMPEAGLGIVVLTNGNLSALPRLVVGRILRSAFDEPQLDVQLAVDSITSTRLAFIDAGFKSELFDESTALSFEGDYSDPNGGDLNVSSDKGYLLFDFDEIEIPVLRFIDRVVDPDGTGQLVGIGESGPLAGQGFIMATAANGKKVIAFNASGVVYNFIQQ